MAGDVTALDRFVRDLLPALLLGGGLLLGGSSSGGAWANAALQLLAVAALAVLVLRRSSPPLAISPISGWLTGLVAAIVLVPLLQLVPLPPALWTALPGRSNVREGFDLAGLALPWLPISLDRDATLAVLASLLPPLAGVAVLAGASGRGWHRALVTLVGIALGSILLGAVQQLGGEGTAFQPYALTNPGKATGLFANRNHLATLLVMAMPCAALLLSGPRHRWSAATVIALLLAGTVLTGSRAGIGLGVASALASLIWVAPPLAARPRAVASKLVAALLAALVLGGLATWWFVQASAGPPPGGAEQHRPAMIATTLTAARDYFPVGSGGGSFVRIYPHYEDPAAADPQYRNHAHSDYAEVLLEYGAAGALLLLAVAAWWARRVLAAWRAGPASAEARAGLTMLGLALAHSAVDYPLRTAALAMVAALAAVLIERNRAGFAPAPVPPRAAADKHLHVAL